MIKHTQTIHGQQSTNCLSVFDHFVGLVFKGSISIMTNKWLKWTNPVNVRQECTYSWLEKISNISLIVLLFYKIFSKMACMLGQFSQMQKNKIQFEQSTFIRLSFVTTIMHYFWSQLLYFFIFLLRFASSFFWKKKKKRKMKERKDCWT